MSTLTDAFVRHQLHGEAKSLGRFLEHFKRFDDADRQFMLIYESHIRGGKTEATVFFGDTEEEVRSMMSPVPEGEIKTEMFIFEWDLGVNLISRSDVKSL